MANHCGEAGDPRSATVEMVLRRRGPRGVWASDQGAPAQRATFHEAPADSLFRGLTRSICIGQRAVP